MFSCSHYMPFVIVYHRPLPHTQNEASQKGSNKKFKKKSLFYGIKSLLQVDEVFI